MQSVAFFRKKALHSTCQLFNMLAVLQDTRQPACISSFPFMERKTSFKHLLSFSTRVVISYSRTAEKQLGFITKNCFYECLTKNA